MSKKQESAAAACWTIAPRPAHWFSRATSASRSPAISRRSDRRSSRGFDRSASRNHFGEPFARRFADDDVVNSQLAAVPRQGAIELAFRHRRYLGDDRPGVAIVSTFENLAIGIDGIKRATARP